MAFKFKVGQKLSKTSLLSECSADYLKGHHATIVARLVDADDGLEKYAIREWYYAQDSMLGDLALYADVKVEAEYIEFTR